MSRTPRAAAPRRPSPSASRGGGPACNYYVWYRVAGDACEARSAVTAMMLDLAEECGVVGRLLKRADDPSTWMEIYEAVEDSPAFEHALAGAIARHGATDYANGARHVERFVACGALDPDA